MANIFLDLDYVDEKEYLKFAANSIRQYARGCVCNGGNPSLWNILAALLDVADGFGIKYTSRIENGAWVFSITYGLDKEWFQAGKELLLEVFGELSCIKPQISCGSGWLEAKIPLTG